jgi:GNAT superfamily N-acetyltransferase
MTAPFPSISLIPLTDAEYASFAEQSVVETARQHAMSGEWTQAEAMGRAREEEAELLADRLRGVGHYFFKAVDHQRRCVGWIWVSPGPEFLGVDRQGKWWLSQITVEEGMRAKGVGRAMLAALHAWLAGRGALELWLRVYDWNEPARRLYAGMGYEVARRFDIDAHLRRRIIAEDASLFLQKDAEDAEDAAD